MGDACLLIHASFDYICNGLNIRDILERYKADNRIQALAQALNASKNPRVQLRGLVGSGDAAIAVALYFLQHKHMVFILPDREEAGYFQADLENLTGKEILLFPSSYRKPFEFTQPDSSNVLARAEVLNELNHSSEFGQLIVTYPEALAEKVIDRASLEKNTLEIAVSNKLSIDFINEFLVEYDFDRVDFVYEPGQFSIRGGIVDIFSFSHELPYRVEFFGDFIESIRTFEIESQLSVEQVKTITIVPNVQSKFLTENNISLLEYVDSDTQIWIKDVQFTLDIIQTGYKKATQLWKALSAEEKTKNPDWIDPKFGFTDEKLIADQLHDFPLVEFGKQFFYQTANAIHFDMRPQPSFNKDFSLLIHNFKNNEAEKIENYILTDSARQVERLYAILEDLDKTVKFTPVSISVREGFVDREQKIACYTDHQIFDRYYKYKLKKGYQRSQAITLKELRELKPGDYVTHIDHGIGKYAGLEKVEVNGKQQEMIRLIYADNDLLYVNINSLNRISKYSGKEGTVPKMNKLGTDTWEKLKKTTKKKVKDIARDLIKLYALRKAQHGNAFSRDSYLQTELEASFIYEDTPDQEKATADFKKDMESPFISFTQIDTDQEILIPDEYVTSISERYNLYTDLSKLENETELKAFQQQLHDRFGPIPAQVNDLLNTMRLQWLGKSIGFEKISLKKNVLRGYFISNQQSPYFETEAFRQVLSFVQANPRRTNLKEVKNSLRLSIEGVNSINQAVNLLSEIGEPVVV
eukprot:gene7274-7346_t